MVIAATVPAIMVALLAKDFIEVHLRSTTVIAVATLFFGGLLALADFKSRRQHEVLEMTWRIALIIGFAQVLALIPGTSRSGVTITAAVLLGLSKTEGARFSFLLSIPIIAAAGGYAILNMLSDPPIFSWWQLGLGVAVSAVSAYLCIKLFLQLLERIGFMPFVWYRLVLGCVLLAMI
jgi:undecaprenyl-diphosphatase